MEKKPPKFTVDVEVKVPSKYQVDIDLMRSITFETLRNKSDKKNSLSLDTFMKASYRMRVCSTFPFLASIVNSQGLRLTAAKMKKNAWDLEKTPNNPYVVYFDGMLKSSPKLPQLADKISTPNLGICTSFTIRVVFEANIPNRLFLADSGIHRIRWTGNTIIDLSAREFISTKVAAFQESERIRKDGSKRF